MSTEQEWRQRQQKKRSTWEYSTTQHEHKHVCPSSQKQPPYRERHPEHTEWTTAVVRLGGQRLTLSSHTLSPLSCVFFGHRHSNASLPCASQSRNTAVRRLFLVCPAKRRVVCLAISGSRLWLISASCSTLTCYRVSLYLPFFTVSPCFWRLYFLLLPISMCIFIFLIAQAITKLNFSPVNLNQSNFTSPQANLYCTLQAKIASAGLQLLTCNRHLS